MKKNNSIIYIIAFTLFLIFVGAPFFNWIATNEWQWQFINERNYDAWIGYYGAIIGGALTLGGVWWTIKDTEKQRKDDLATQYKPNIRISNVLSDVPNFCSYNIIKYSVKEQVNDDYKNIIIEHHNYTKFVIEIENIGRGILTDLKLNNIDIVSNDIEQNFYYKEMFITSIPEGTKFYVVLEIPPLLMLKKQYITLQESQMGLKIILSATDEFHYNEFNIYLDMLFDVTYVKYKGNIVTPTFTTNRFRETTHLKNK